MPSTEQGVDYCAACGGKAPLHCLLPAHRDCWFPGQTTSMKLLDEQPVQVDWMTADNIFIKQIHIKQKDAIVPQHSHRYDHTTAVVAGAILAWKDGEPLGRFDAPALIFIEAGAKHTFRTISENTVLWCCHNGMRPDVAAILAEHDLDLSDDEISAATAKKLAD